MEITPEQIRDYEACARYYDFKYHDKLNLKKNTRLQRTEEFEETIHRVANYYLYKKQAFGDPTLNSLWNRWQRDWYGDITAADIARMQNSVQQRSKTAYGTRALEVMQLFYDDFKDVKGDQVFWLNEDYIVPILKQKATLSGKVDLVVRDKKTNTFSIYKWINSTNIPSDWRYNLIAADYAFKYRYNFKDIKTRHFVWSFFGAKIGAAEIALESKDFASMGYWADEMINDKVFMDRYGYSTYCKTCPYEAQCLKWNLQQEEIEHGTK